MKPNPRIVVSVALAVIAGAAAFVIARRGNGPKLDATGTVEAIEARLGFQVPGRL